MKRLIAPGIAIGAALAISACGSGGGGSAGTSAASPSAGGAGSAPISVKQISGVGRVLVDRSGMAVYTPNLEASGKISIVKKRAG